ncbi:hypothetical protein ACTFIU_006006 [Dictyostelium citrinum]
MTKELNSNSTSLNSSNNGNNIINIPTPYETSLERIDLIPLKKQLDAVLKDRSEDYWEWIRKYLCGRLSKRELDYYVTTNLNEPNLHLHNTFFKAVIFNAFYSKTSPTIIEQTKVPISSTNQTATNNSLPAKRKLSSSTNSTTKEKKDKKDTSSTSSTSSSASSSSSSKRKKEKNPTKRPRREKKDSAPSISGSSSSLTTSSSLKLKQKKKLFPKYSLFSSQLQPLKNKMEEIASENGLQGISKQSIIFMKLALEQHILNFLRKSKPHIQLSLPNSYSIPPNQLPPPSPFLDYFFSNIDNTQSNDNNDNSQNDENSKYINNNVNNHLNEENEKDKENEKVKDNEKEKEKHNEKDNENEKEKEKINEVEKEQELEPMILNDDNINDKILPLPVVDQSPQQQQLDILPNQKQQPTTFSFNSIFNFNQFNGLNKNNNNNNNNNDKLELNYPKYVESNNPLLSQSVSFYKIPDNIFSNAPPTSILSTQDIFSMVEDNSLILGNDPLAFERINLFRC